MSGIAPFLLASQQIPSVGALIVRSQAFQIKDAKMRNKQYILFLTLAAALPAVAADDTSARLGNAVDVFNTMTQSAHGIRA
jgi:hypothetical protein